MTVIEQDSPPGGLLDFPNPSKEGENRNAKPEEQDKRAPTGRPRGRPPKAKLKDSLQAQFTIIGMSVYAFNHYDGERIMENSQALAESLGKLADENPRVRKVLEKMLMAGAWSEVGMAVAPMLLPILANHRVLPPFMATVVGAPEPPEKPKVNPPAYPQGMGNG